MEEERNCSACGSSLDYFDLPEGPRWLCEYCEMMIPALVREQLLVRISALEKELKEVKAQLEITSDALNDITEEYDLLWQSWEENN